MSLHQSSMLLEVFSLYVSILLNQFLYEATIRIMTPPPGINKESILKSVVKVRTQYR